MINSRFVLIGNIFLADSLIDKGLILINNEIEIFILYIKK